MKKILITGANGYIGRNIINALQDDYVNIIPLTHQELDLTNSDAVNLYFSLNNFDWVIHCAAVGGRRNDIQEDKSDVYIKNVAMFDNISINKKHFGKLISFGSGAEFDRRFKINYRSNIWTDKPIDNYGLSKNKIARLIEQSNDFYNIRLFGVFSADELPDRFIKANLMRYIQNQSMIIHQDRYMDFFAMEDLMTIVRNYILNDDILILPKCLNAVYDIKPSLVYICNYINSLDNLRNVPIHISQDKMNTNYVGEYNQKFMKYCGMLKPIENIWYRISRMYIKLKEINNAN
jgi:GDP-L-fucose synthase